MKMANANSVVVVMGTCGAGKSVVAEAVALHVGGSFVDADDHHSAEAKARMAAGDALTDAHRLPWLDRVAAAARLASRPTLVACSALKRSYRDRLRLRLPAPTFVHLDAPHDVIAARLAARQDHFVSANLLASQFSILEPLGPNEAGITLDASAPLQTVCDQVLNFMAINSVATINQDDALTNRGGIHQHMQGR